MTPEELAAAIRTVLEEASAEGSLALPAAEIPDPRVERPRNRDHGDWSTNVAMQLAKKAGTKPRDLAELLVPRLEALDGVASAHAADLEVHVWTVDEPERMRQLADLNVDAIMTDVPTLALQTLG